MSEAMTGKPKYRGRLSQIGIYFGKLIRMFIYQSDWKVLPMGAIIAALVVFVTCGTMFVYQEGTTNGTFALTCACIWNGFFNAIQVVCRERDIIKREHRAGMHISSYIISHMLYQLILCFLQTLIILLICWIAKTAFPPVGVITPWGFVDFAITILLVTFTADMMALMVSCIVKTTTTAMTVMPFLLIFQLIFAGGFFELGAADFIKYATISHWGIDSLCIIGRYNNQPMVTLWNTLFQFKDIEISGQKPVLYLIREVSNNNMMDDFLLWSGQNNANPAYESIPANVWTAWGAMALMIALFAIVSVVALKFIDRDKR